MNDDIIVVGAGPVGLTMALELARHGCRCRIVDRLAAPSGYCKAIGVTPRTLEVWDDMGIAARMIDNGLWITGLRTIMAGGPAHDTVADLSALPYANLGLPQYATEALLGDELAKAGILVERGVALAGIEQRADGVDVELERADGSKERAACRFVVGCDGAHSAVRHLTGIGFPGEGMGIDFMLGDVEIAWDVPRGMAVFSITPKEDAPPDFLVVVPLPGRNRYRVSMVAPPELADNGAAAPDDHGIASERPGPTLDELQAVADRLLPGRPRLSAVRWSSLFRISMRLADRYRVGNAFIAGDAAHIHPPTGGQGMNTGIQDAYNLAWKLALVARGEAGPALLDSYEAERRPVGADVVRKTLEASRNFGRERGKEDPLENTQVLISYRGSPAVTDLATPDALAVRAGDRAPDAERPRPARVRLSVAAVRPAARARARARRLAGRCGRQRSGAAGDGRGRPEAEFGPLLRVVGIAGKAAQTPSDPVGAVVAVDSEGRFAAAYRACGGSSASRAPRRPCRVDAVRPRRRGHRGASAQGAGQGQALALVPAGIGLIGLGRLFEAAEAARAGLRLIRGVLDDGGCARLRPLLPARLGVRARASCRAWPSRSSRCA